MNLCFVVIQYRLVSIAAISSSKSILIQQRCNWRIGNEDLSNDSGSLLFDISDYVISTYVTNVRKNDISSMVCNFGYYKHMMHEN